MNILIILGLLFCVFYIYNLEKRYQRKARIYRDLIEYVKHKTKKVHYNSNDTHSTKLEGVPSRCRISTPEHEKV